jgi:D-arginine dehydrogenase
MVTAGLVTTGWDFGSIRDGSIMENFDVIVIGAGMAGASVAAHLAATHRIALVERERQPGYHSTGRSAALFSEIYGNPVVRALSRASRQFLTEPPDDFAPTPLVRPRGCLFVATTEQLPRLREFAALPDIGNATRSVDAAEARRMCPILRDDYVAAALLEQDSMDIDVDALHRGYLRLLRRRGGRLIGDVPVQSLKHDARTWTVRAGTETLTAAVLVNAAGAWADEVAALAGVRPLGLQPYRRTALLIDPPADTPIAAWPMVIDSDEQFYFKPEAALLLLSPGDETASVPCDAQPEEWDVAVAVERMQTATTLPIDRVRRRWAGLRSFVADRSPVAGYAGDAEGFFWLAGQGGYGIQTADALARAAAALVRNLDLPDDLKRLDIRADALSPSRLK